MRCLLTILLCMLVSPGAFSDWRYPPEVNSAFEEFFGDAISNDIHPGTIRLITERIYGLPNQMPVKMEFDVEGVEKILLLKVPSNGYGTLGLFSEECANEPAFIASYTVDSKINLSELEASIRTRCRGHNVTLMLWVKAAQGYYLDTASFYTTGSNHENDQD